MATESQRERLRAEFPENAKIIDEFRRVFGEVRVKWLSENGKEIGKRSPPGVVASVHPKLPPKRPSTSSRR